MKEKLKAEGGRRNIRRESIAFHANLLAIFSFDVIRSGRRGRKDIIYAYIRKSDLTSTRVFH